MNGAVSSIIWFVVIIAMIPIALWLFKRTPMGGSTTSTFMRHIAALPISQNQRLVTVEIGTGDDRRWLVLGVTAQSITTLHTMAPGAELPVSVPLAAPQAFAQMLNKFKGDKGASGDR